MQITAKRIDTPVNPYERANPIKISWQTANRTLHLNMTDAEAQVLADQLRETHPQYKQHRDTVPNPLPFEQWLAKSKQLDHYLNLDPHGKCHELDTTITRLSKELGV